MPMTTPRPHSRQPKQLDAGILQAEISSFALRLAGEGKAAKTIRTYTEAVQWFAAGLPGLASWEQVSRQDIQRRMTWLLGRYSSAYASRRRAARPDGRAAASARHPEARPGLLRRGRVPWLPVRGRTLQYLRGGRRTAPGSGCGTSW
jgi:hypothetical protein